MVSYIDFFGNELKDGDIVIPITGDALFAYNLKLKYIHENINENYNPKLRIEKSNLKNCDGIYLMYEDYKEEYESQLNCFFKFTYSLGEYSTPENIAISNTKHKYVLSAGRLIIADKLVDTGYKDMYGETIYESSILSSWEEDEGTYNISNENGQGYLINWENEERRPISLEEAKKLEVWQTTEE